MCTFIIWGILQLSQKFAKRFGLSGFQSGVYGTPPLKKQLKRWLKQLLVYISALLIMKLVVVTFFHLCPWIENFGEWILGWTKGNYKLQVLFVMLIFPLIMNIAQFWIIDTIVKHNVNKTPIYLDDALDEDILIPIYDDIDSEIHYDDDDDEYEHYYDDVDDVDNRYHDNDNNNNGDNDYNPRFLASWPLHLTTVQDDEQDAVSLSSSLKILNPRRGDDDNDHDLIDDGNNNSHVKKNDP
ncbi:unnamed protein product [Cunninghamella blakesleeana]